MQVERFKDYCPNGLQVEGRSEIRKIVSGVTASMALLEAAQRHLQIIGLPSFCGKFRTSQSGDNLAVHCSDAGQCGSSNKKA